MTIEGDTETVRLRGGGIAVYEPLWFFPIIMVPSKPSRGLRFELGPLSGKIPLSGWAAGLINLAENKFGVNLRRQ